MLKLLGIDIGTRHGPLPIPASGRTETAKLVRLKLELSDEAETYEYNRRRTISFQDDVYLVLFLSFYCYYDYDAVKMRRTYFLRLDSQCYGEVR